MDIYPVCTCTKCGETKRLYEFYPCKTKEYSSGRRPECIACRKAERPPKPKPLKKHRWSIGFKL